MKNVPVPQGTGTFFVDFRKACPGPCTEKDTIIRRMTEFSRLCLGNFRPFADFRRNWSKTLDSARYFFYNMGRNNNRHCA